MSTTLFEENDMKQDTALALPAQTVTPMTLIERASAQGASIEQMAQLFELKMRVEADEARKAFNEAMTAFKGHAIRVTKDKVNVQYGSRYTTLGNLIQTVTPYLSQHGMSASWNIDQNTGIKVTCTIRHALGHSESVSMTCPPDVSGAKNPIQQIKSSITYAKACTFESACGLASTDANLDDDGNGASEAKQMNEQAYIAHLDNIQAAHNAEELRRIFGAAYKEAQAAGDTAARDAFIKAKDNRRAELSK
jgi:hypothetical protein